MPRKTAMEQRTDSDSGIEEGRNTNNYFAWPSLVNCLVIGASLLLFEILCFHSHIFPFAMLGKPGQRLKYLTDNYLPQMRLGFTVTVIIHTGETIYSHFICRRIGLSSQATVKWMLQTFIFGFLSLRLLKKYEEDLSKKIKAK